MTAHRIAPAQPPYDEDIQDRLERIMPKGVPPLLLFRTLARSPRIFERVMSGGFLDKGALSLRQREIVIDRTCARCGAEYEWGVHMAFFADKVDFGEAEISATVHGDASDPVWHEAEGLLIQLVDALHDNAHIDDDLWSALSAQYSHEQILELIALCGFYHMISFLVNGLGLPGEAYGRRFPKPAAATLEG